FVDLGQLRVCARHLSERLIVEVELPRTGSRLRPIAWIVGQARPAEIVAREPCGELVVIERYAVVDLALRIEFIDQLDLDILPIRQDAPKTKCVNRHTCVFHPGRSRHAATPVQGVVESNTW